MNLAVYLGLHLNEFEGTIPNYFCGNKISMSIDCLKVKCVCCQCKD